MSSFDISNMTADTAENCGTECFDMIFSFHCSFLSIHYISDWCAASRVRVPFDESKQDGGNPIHIYGGYV